MATPPSPPRPHTFILDFDGTITTQDTISTLARYIFKHSSQTPDLEKAWTEIVSAYSKDFSAHVANYRPVKEDRKTLEEEIEYHRSLKEIEHASFERVSDSGVFKNEGSEMLRELGARARRDGDVVARKGIEEFMERVELCGVVSVNFSRDWVRGVVNEVSSGREIDVVANIVGADGGLSGYDVWGGGRSRDVIVTSDGKLRAVKELVAYWWKKGVLAEDSGDVVYVGDSGTDIECLVKEGVVGIVMSEDGESSLQETLRRVGVKVLPVSEFRELEKGRSLVYWARDFDEILQSPLFSPI